MCPQYGNLKMSRYVNQKWRKWGFKSLIDGETLSFIDLLYVYSMILSCLKTKLS